MLLACLLAGAEVTTVHDLTTGDGAAGTTQGGVSVSCGMAGRHCAGVWGVRTKTPTKFTPSPR